MTTPIAIHTRLKDLPEGTRFKISGCHSRGVFVRVCNKGVRTACSEASGREVVLHLENFVDPVPTSEEALAPTLVE